MSERHRGPDRVVLDEIRQDPGGSRHIRTFLQRGVIFTVGMLLLYTVQQQLLEIVSSADRLREISIGWFGIMVLAEVISFGCMWALIRLMLPRLSWFVAGTSQLVSNSVSRVVPGGAAVGGATLYRMLAVSGVQPPQAASAMAATSILSNALLFAIPRRCRVAGPGRGTRARNASCPPPSPEPSSSLYSWGSGPWQWRSRGRSRPSAMGSDGFWPFWVGPSGVSGDSSRSVSWRSGPD